MGCYWDQWKNFHLLLLGNSQVEKMRPPVNLSAGSRMDTGARSRNRYGTPVFQNTFVHPGLKTLNFIAYHAHPLLDGFQIKFWVLVTILTNIKLRS
jgi:hypothetical protein